MPSLKGCEALWLFVCLRRRVGGAPSWPEGGYFQLSANAARLFDSLSALGRPLHTTRVFTALIMRHNR